MLGVKYHRISPQASSFGLAYKGLFGTKLSPGPQTPAHLPFLMNNSLFRHDALHMSQIWLAEKQLLPYFFLFLSLWSGGQGF